MSLRKINFEKILHLPLDANGYSYEQYQVNSEHHPVPHGFCISCEQKGLHTGLKDSSFHLNNISHGTHGKDLITAYKLKIDTKGWHEEPVMFIFQSPARSIVMEPIAYKGWNKRPTPTWYWADDPIDPERFPIFPEYFEGGQYGGLIVSIMNTFRLSKVYITNLVKCGLNNPEGQYAKWDNFRPECIENCYQEILQHELGYFQPKTIFACGSGVYDTLGPLLQKYGKKEIADLLYRLPHPASVRRGLVRDHYSTICFWTIVRALSDMKILSKLESSALLEKYLGADIW